MWALCRAPTFFWVEGVRLLAGITCRSTGIQYNQTMKTLIESEEFSREAAKLWTDEEYFQFTAWIAQNPSAGDVIPHTNGFRKVRWNRPGKGKRGGVRVIYFNADAQGWILLLAIYAKSERENMTAHEINKRKT
jgi:hypothetical protein